eukprot:COSAG01_NODE_66379_length_270_cov_0.766082_1_plen_32_part_01
MPPANGLATTPQREEGDGGYDGGYGVQPKLSS